jgi:hypothetical protein
MIDLAYTVAGLLVGAVVGLTGVGGGSLMTPILMLGFGVQPSVAVGTDLLYAAATKAGGTVAHARRGTVDWRIPARLAAGSMPAAGVTLWAITTWLPGGLGGASRTISVSLGIALLLTSTALVFRRWILRYASSHGDAEAVGGGARTTFLTVLVGVVLGVLVTLSSVGAGALGVTALVFLYPRLPAVRIVGADIAHAVPLTLVAGLGHLALGSVDGWMLASLLLGSLPGIWIGSHYSVKVPEQVLRPILAGMLVLVAVKLIVG